MKGLTVAFGERRVVDNLCYSLGRARTLGIVGESGSGKSVSSLALLGLLGGAARVSGSAMLNGEELIGLGEKALRKVRGKRIGMIFQEPMTSLNPVQKCGAQVLEMMEAHGTKDRKRVTELFEEVMLPRPEKIFDSFPHELSGGQKQRVMIAMALAAEPDILIADEPTTALDVTVQKTILELLRDLQRRHGTSIIFISHDLGVIAQVADEVLVMYRGTVVEQGAARDVLQHPQHRYTQGLLACRPPLDSHPRRLPTVEEYMVQQPAAAREPDERTANSLVSPASLPSEQPTANSLASPASLPSEQPTADGQRPPLISVKDLEVTYTLQRSVFGRPLQTLKGVAGVSFDIMEGETLGLVGESGCGKSTLGRALLRLIDSSSGSVAYRGTPLDTLSSRQMRALRPRLQIVFQDPYSSLNPRLTIGDAIAEPLRVHGGESRRGTVRDTVVAMMEQVGLKAEWWGRYPHQLSGGQRQRVCIARALVLRPELVVCDESVSALDVSVQAQVLNLLNDLKEHYHLTYLFITHDLSVVHYMADRILVMQQGRIVENGTPDQLFRSPQTEYTRRLIDSIPSITQ